MSERSAPFDVFRIEQEIRARHPEVVFASPRTLRRVIRADRGLPAFWPRIPHREIVVIAARRLAEIADDFWAFPADLPETILLVARPDADRYQTQGLEALLRAYWRRLFHGQLDARLAGLDAAARARIAAAVPPDILGEARAVLEQELAVGRDAGDDAVRAEFVATFLELRGFAPDVVGDWFPAIADADALADVLGPEVAAGDLFAATRPAGIESDDDPAEPVAIRPVAAARGMLPAWWPRPTAAFLRRGADRAAARGNLVRAILDELRAATAGDRSGAAEPRANHVAAFARRVVHASGAGEEAVARWAAFIRGVAVVSGGSAWTASARLLFDLQKLCVDAERESYATRLLSWLASAGRRPLTKPLPCQRLLAIHRHAVKASTRLARLGAEVGGADGADLLAGAVSATGRAARSGLQPQVEAAIHGAGLVPGCLVEEAAFDTLVDELLDGMLDRGFISFGDLRDTVSRNQLKLPDLAGIGEWLAGDQLLRADRALGAALDGAYRPAPVYLAVLQRLSAPFFGVGAGRLLTTHLLLPFGAAWIALHGVDHVIEPLTAYSLGETWHIYTTARMLAIGLLLWCLLHVPAVRLALRGAVRVAGAAAYEIVIAIPARLLRLPAVAAVLSSLPVTWFRRHLASPLVVSAAVWLCLPHHGGAISRSTPWVPPVLFAVVTALLSSRVGRLAQERIVEGIGRAVHQFHIHILTGLVAWIIDLFRRAVDAVEGTLYAVDEQLRFHSGESRAALAVKSVLAAAWSVVDAGVRFCVTLLIEPQLNPIKHFPVVTVSHKLLVPMIPMVAGQLVATTGMEKGLALTVVTFVSTCIPGVFGFLAWELKENWRLYAANRPGSLRPVQVGPHGETVRRLLLPGFHSGTIPKLFAALRRSRGASRGSAQRRAALAEHHLHDLELEVGEFIEHECLGLVRRAAGFAGVVLRVADVALAVDRIGIAVAADALGPEPLEIEFVRRDGGIESRVRAAGWLAALDGPRQAAVRLAIAGLHRLAGADRATAAFVEPAADPQDRPQPGSDGLAPVTPFPWATWRDAWDAAAAVSQRDAHHGSPQPVEKPVGGTRRSR
jgi:hypothetical protein